MALTNGIATQATCSVKRILINRFSHNLYLERSLKIAWYRFIEQKCHWFGRAKSVFTPRPEEEILARKEYMPGTIAKRITTKVGINTLFWRIFHQQLLYSYREPRVQALNPLDHQVSLAFCRWFLRSDARDPRFPDNILFTD